MKKLIFFNAKRAEAIQLPLSLDINHYYKSEDNILVDGLVSNITDTGLDANANFAQADIVKCPQYGYDKVGAYVADAAKLTFNASNEISEWRNSETNAGVLGTLTQSVTIHKPKWDDTNGCLIFDNSDTLRHTFSAKNIPVLTVNIVAQFATMTTSVTIGPWFILFHNSSVGANDGIILFLQRSGTDQVMLRVALGTSVGRYYIDKHYTFAEFNALFTNKTSITVVFNNSKLEVFVNAARILSGIAPSNPLIVQLSGTYEVIRNNLTLNANKIFSLQVFESALTNNEILLLHQNNANYSYSLPKNSIVSTGSSFMQNTLSLSQTNEFTVGAYVYFPTLASATLNEILISTNTPSKGFQLKLIRSGSNVYFNFTCYYDVTVMEANSALIPISTFNTLYANRYIQIAGTFDNGKIAVLVEQGALGSSVSATTQFEQSADGIVTLMGVNNTASLSAGIRVEGIFITEDALSATQLLLRKEIDIINLPHIV